MVSFSGSNTRLASTAYLDDLNDYSSPIIDLRVRDSNTINIGENVPNLKLKNRSPCSLEYD